MHGGEKVRRHGGGEKGLFVVESIWAKEWSGCRQALDCRRDGRRAGRLPRASGAGLGALSGARQNLLWKHMVSGVVVRQEECSRLARLDGGGHGIGGVEWPCQSPVQHWQLGRRQERRARGCHPLRGAEVEMR